jgi:hypothetical protein
MDYIQQVDLYGNQMANYLNAIAYESVVGCSLLEDDLLTYLHRMVWVSFFVNFSVRRAGVLRFF